MWFFTEFFERYTRNLARSLQRMATLEVEASRHAAQAVRRQNTVILPERQLTVPPTFAAERRDLVRSRELAADIAQPGEEVSAQERAKALAETAKALVEADKAAAQKTLRSLDAMPAGVRGEVVLKWIATLTTTPRGEASRLLERLEKDKKVRVAELQIIAADVVGEPVTMRRKADHLETLRRHLAPRAAPAPASSARPMSAAHGLNQHAP